MSDVTMEGRGCYVCGKPATQRCSACRATYYCCFEHQKIDWKSHRKSCLPIIVANEDAELGVHWIAGRDIKPGSSILKESPALRWPTWPSVNTLMVARAPCLACGNFMTINSKEWRTCTLCQWPICSRACEEASIHKKNECSEFLEFRMEFPLRPGKNISKILEYAIAMLRLTKLRRRDALKYNEIMNLSVEPKVIHDTKHLVLFHEILMRFPCFLSQNEDPAMTYADLRRSIWVLKLNRFYCSLEGEIDCAGLGHEKFGMICIYLKATHLTKSCIPNCAHSLSPVPPDFSMVVRAAVPIEKGKALTIVRRGGDAIPTMRRQKEMRQEFEFVCQCERCLDPTELGTFPSAVVCPVCRRNNNGEIANVGYMLPTDPLIITDAAIWKCNKCEDTVTAAEFLPGIYDLADAINDVDDAELIDGILRVNSGKYLHPNHWVMQMAVSRLLDFYHEHGCPPRHAHHFTTLTKFRLGLEDILNPGISFNRATFQRDFLLVMWPIMEKLLIKAPDSIRVDFQEQLALCQKYVEESQRYFKLFENSLLDGEISLRILTTMKTAIEATKININLESCAAYEVPSPHSRSLAVGIPEVKAMEM